LYYYYIIPAWAHQDKLNGWDNPSGTSEERAALKELKNFFTLNLDESCVMASEGIVRVLGNAEKTKHEKNIQDNRDSITTVRTGSAGNVDGPRIYLAKGKTCDLESFNDFGAHYDSPPGSCVVMTPNAYMTNEAWKTIYPKLCKGIREMRVICDHPDKWIVFSLDGFGSHLCPESLLVFNEYKILVIKEEGDTSQVSQAYDQLVAKLDKKYAREMLEVTKMHLKKQTCQWQLIIIVNEALNEVAKTEAWKKSFIRVNMCPSEHQPFTDWVQKHEKSVKAADRFFKNRTSLFDAMPAVWQHLSESERCELCALFDTFDGIWSTDNLRKVMALGMVKLDEIDKLRGCYLTAKEDPSVFV